MYRPRLKTRAERAENWVELSEAVSGSCRKTMERNGARSRRSRSGERRLQKIRWSAERPFRRSLFAHMLWAWTELHRTT